jgi:hypothetical protein
MKLIEENRSIRGKTCPSASLSTTNPTWTDPGSNPGFRRERPATNRLSHGTVLVSALALEPTKFKINRCVGSVFSAFSVHARFLLVMKNNNLQCNNTSRHM